MRKRLGLCAIALGLSAGVATADQHSANPPSLATMCSSPSIELRTTMRKLWEEHITYTRNFIISALGNLPDQNAVTQRLLKNQDDIGDAIKPYYGKEAGEKLSALLRDHIAIAADVVKAAKSGNKKLLAKQQERWTANAKAIAGFLATANPNWQQGTLEDMLQKHLDLTTGEVVGRLTKAWAKDIASYDEGHAHMLMFADAITDGVIKQFPDTFHSDAHAQR